MPRSTSTPATLSGALVPVRRRPPSRNAVAVYLACLGPGSRRTYAWGLRTAAPAV